MDHTSQPMQNISVTPGASSTVAGTALPTHDSKVPASQTAADIGASYPDVVAAPVPVQERIPSLDILRGFAVLGILAMNIQFFSMPGAAYTNPTAWGDLTGINLAVWVISNLLFDLKFISLFSMLFGAGILLMLNRASERGVRHPLSLHLKRMAWLLLFGLVHAYVFWGGDILVTYAVLGSILWRMHSKSTRQLMLASVSLILGGTLLWLAMGFSMPYWPEEDRVELRAEWAPSAEELQKEVAAFRGSWLEQMPYRAKAAFFVQVPGLVFFTLWRVGGMLLLGMALFKSGFLSGNWELRRYWQVAAFCGLPGLALSLTGIQQNFARGWTAEYSMFIGSQWNYVGSALVAVSYAAIILAIWKLAWLPSLTSRLAAVGRMAFSNYILQTLLCTTLFYGHGFALFGSFERWQQAAVPLCTWALILLLSPWWIRRYGQGPLERMWRRLTYGRPVLTQQG